MVGFSQGMVSKVLNPRALGLGQSLTKAVSPRDRETSSFFSSLVRSLVVFLEFQYSVSEQFQYLSPADFRCLRGLLKTEIVCTFPCAAAVGQRYPERLTYTQGLSGLCGVLHGTHQKNTLAIQ